MQEIQRQTAVMLTSLLREAVPFDFLIAALQDADAAVRQLVCTALEGLADRANPDWLIPLLEDRDSDVRRAAEYALIPFGNRASLEPVLQALIKRGVDFEDPLAQVLGTFQEAFPRSLMESLVESHPEVAAVIMGELGRAAPVELLDALLAMPDSKNTRAIRFEALRAAIKVKDRRLIPRLVAIMRDEQDNNRCDAAPALGAIGDPQYIPEIVQLLSSAKIIDIIPVAEGLAGFGERMPVKEMVEYIQAYPPEESDDIREVVDAFQYAGRKTPYGFLVTYLQDTSRDPQARGMAATALATFAQSGLATAEQYDAIRRLLIETLQTEGDSIFRHYVGYSLGVLKDPSALEPLMAAAMLQHEESFVAIGAAQGLYLLALAGFHAPVEKWKTVLDQSADMRRKYAIWALGSREDAPSSLLLDYFADPHLKTLAHEQLLHHPPSNALDLARNHLALLAQTENDPLSSAASKALTDLEGLSN